MIIIKMNSIAYTYAITDELAYKRTPSTKISTFIK